MEMITAASHSPAPAATRDSAGFLPRPADWSTVRDASYALRQTYRYTYTQPVTNLRQRLMVVPPDRHGDQRLLGYDLDVGGGSDTGVVWSLDRVGNRVAEITAAAVSHEITFAVSYRVQRQRLTGAAGLGCGWPASRYYLTPTARTAPDDRLEAAAADIARRTSDPAERAEAAHDWAAGAIRYQFGVTGVQTPAAMALHLGYGVCQDYAHLMLVVLRLLGIPGRYVSGHLLGEGAPHAWVEALVPGAGHGGRRATIAYDPTHHRRVGLQYITVAVGRDYADISPTSGFFSGTGVGRLTAEKQAGIIELRTEAD